MIYPIPQPLIAPTTKPRLYFVTIAEVPPEVIPYLIMAGVDGRVRAPIPQLPFAKRQIVSQVFAALTPEEPVVTEEIPDLVTAGTSRKVRSPLKRIASGQFAPQVIGKLEAAAEPAPEVIPVLVAADTGSNVRSSGKRKRKTYDAPRVYPLEATPVVPLTFPIFVAANTNSSIRKAVQKPPAKPRVTSQLFFGLETTVAPVVPDVLPTVIAAGVDGYTRRSPAYVKVEPDPGDVYYFYDLIDEGIPIVVSADVGEKIRAGAKLGGRGLGKPQLIVGRADPIPPAEFIPPLVVADGNDKVRRGAKLKGDRIGKPRLFYRPADPVAPTQMPDIVMAGVGKGVRRGFEHPKEEPWPTEVYYYFEEEEVPKVIMEGVDGRVRKGIGRATVPFGQRSQIFVGVVDPLPPPQEIPTVVTAGVYGNVRKSVREKQATPFIRSQIMFPGEAPPTPPSGTDWRSVNAIDLEEGRVMKLWLDAGPLT